MILEEALFPLPLSLAHPDSQTKLPLAISALLLLLRTTYDASAGNAREATNLPIDRGLSIVEASSGLLQRGPHQFAKGRYT